MPELTAERSVKVHLDLGRISSRAASSTPPRGSIGAALEAAGGEGRPARPGPWSTAGSPRSLDRQGKFADSRRSISKRSSLHPTTRRSGTTRGTAPTSEGRLRRRSPGSARPTELDPADARSGRTSGWPWPPRASPTRRSTRSPRPAGRRPPRRTSATSWPRPARPMRPASATGKALELNPTLAVARIRSIDRPPTRPTRGVHRPVDRPSASLRSRPEPAIRPSRRRPEPGPDHLPALP